MFSCKFQASSALGRHMDGMLKLRWHMAAPLLPEKPPCQAAASQPVSPDSLQVVGGRHIVVPLELLQHLLAHVGLRLVRCHKDLAHVGLGLLRAQVLLCQLLGSHLMQRISRPLCEPVNGGAVDKACMRVWYHSAC